MNSERYMLMIFVRNARKGQVKTRLAATVGDETALQIYLRLLNHTASVTRDLSVSKSVFYSEFIEEVDEFEIPVFGKFLQAGNQLGDKMMNAFQKCLSRGYEKVVIIGSDCIELNSDLLKEAFSCLDKKDVVIGPAKDGGYYLLGLKKIIPEFFENKIWSSDNVLLDTLLDCKQLSLTYHLLPVLNDIDEEGDLNDELKELVRKK